MRAWELSGGFGLEHLRATQRPDPAPGPGEVKIRLRAASLNYRDLLIIQGVYNPRLAFPLIPVSDGCGEVVAIGEGVRGLSLGEMVIPLFHQAWQGGPPSLERLSQSLGSPLDGVMADYRLFRAEGLVKAPSHLTAEEAATLPCAGVTAWTALMTEGRLAAGETVVIQGTGGVSVFALQFAKLAGARVIVTSSSNEKLERARALGADHLINYRETPDWARPVRALTNGRGADHIVEVGGAGTLDQSLKAIRIGGFISVIGVLAGAEKALSLPRILMQHVHMQGITVGSRDDFEAMARAMSQAKLRPVVDRVFPFEALKQALEHLAQGKHFGKIALSF